VAGATEHLESVKATARKALSGTLGKVIVPGVLAAAAALAYAVGKGGSKVKSAVGSTAGDEARDDGDEGRAEQEGSRGEEERLTQRQERKERRKQRREKIGSAS
jgi:hypothetical protein